jgi:hypothetical protein
MQENNTTGNYLSIEVESTPMFTSAASGVLVLPATADHKKVSFAPRSLMVKCGLKHGDYRGLLQLNFQSLKSVEEIHSLRHDIEYQVRWNDVEVGTVTIDSSDLNQSKHYSADNHVGIVTANPDIFDLLSKTLAALAHYSLIVGRFKFSQEMRQLEEWRYREAGFNTAQLLFAAAGEMASDSTTLLTSNENSTGSRFKSNFGPEVRIQSIRRLPNNYKNLADPDLSVIWCTPNILKRKAGDAADTEFLIMGRHTYQQNLSSFLGLYPTPEHHSGGIDFGQMRNHVYPGCKAVCDYYANKGMADFNICHYFDYATSDQ